MRNDRDRVEKEMQSERSDSENGKVGGGRGEGVSEFQKPKKNIIDRSCRVRSAPAIVRLPSSRRQVREGTTPFLSLYAARNSVRACARA